MAFSSCSSRSNASLLTSRTFLIVTSLIAFRRTMDSADSLFLQYFVCLVMWTWRSSFTTEFCWTKRWSERCGLQLHSTTTAIQNIPCLSETSAHWLCVPECSDNDPTSQTSIVWTLTVWSRLSRKNIAIFLHGSILNRGFHKGDRWSRHKTWAKCDSLWYGGHISRGSEIIFIDFHKGIHDDENNVCLWWSTSFRHFCHLFCVLWETCETVIVIAFCVQSLCECLVQVSCCTLFVSIRDEKRFSLRLSLLSFILLSCCQYRSIKEES